MTGDTLDEQNVPAPPVDTPPSAEDPDPGITAPLEPADPAEDDSAPDASRAGRDAARYRTQLREREAELAAARTLLEAARGEILRAAISEVHVGSSIVRAEAVEDVVAGLELGSLFDAAGRLDAGQLAEAVEQFGAAHPYALETDPERRLVVPGQGRSSEYPKGASWSEAFGPKGY